MSYLYTPVETLSVHTSLWTALFGLCSVLTVPCSVVCSALTTPSSARRTSHSCLNTYSEPSSPVTLCLVLLSPVHSPLSGRLCPAFCALPSLIRLLCPAFSVLPSLFCPLCSAFSALPSPVDSLLCCFALSAPLLSPVAPLQLGSARSARPPAGRLGARRAGRRRPARLPPVTLFAARGG